MRAKLRRQVSAKLKELGIPSKLYRGSKFVFHRRHSGEQMRRMLHGLELSKPGTLVNDCDYLNHIVKGFTPSHFYHTNKSWYGHGIKGYFMDDDLQVEFVDGRWSCGCPASPCDPYTREEIEKCLLDHYEYNYPGDEVDSAVRLRRDALRTGRHIVDERGLLLPELGGHK
jgi:hypothetical protein